MKQTARELNDYVASFKTRMFLLKQELCNKHINEHRMLAGRKRLPMEYDILSELQFPEKPVEDKQDSPLFNSHNSTTFLLTPSSNSALQESEVDGSNLSNVSVEVISGNDCEGTISIIKDTMGNKGTSRSDEESNELLSSRMYRLLWIEN